MQMAEKMKKQNDSMKMLLKIQDIKNMLMFNKKMIRHIIKRLQSKLLKIGTYEVCKISLSYFDDKRYILGDDINSLAYFHKDIQSQ